MTNTKYITKARALEGNRYSSAQKIGHNTWKFVNELHETVIRYTLTDIVKILPNGDRVLNSGGWHTATTKKKINQFLPQGIALVQRAYQWFLNGIPFEDGIRITASGQIVCPSHGRA